MDVGTSGLQFLELLEMDVMLLRNIQSVFEVASNGCYNVASRASGKLIEMDVTTKIPAFWSCLKAIFQHNTWTWLSEVEKIISRLWNYCACHTKAGVTFAPTLGSHSPLPPTEVGANATPHEVGANAIPVPVIRHACVSLIMKCSKPNHKTPIGKVYINALFFQIKLKGLFMASGLPYIDLIISKTLNNPICPIYWWWLFMVNLTIYLPRQKRQKQNVDLQLSKRRAVAVRSVPWRAP